MRFGLMRRKPQCKLFSVNILPFSCLCLGSCIGKNKWEAATDIHKGRLCQSFCWFLYERKQGSRFICLCFGPTRLRPWLQSSKQEKVGGSFIFKYSLFLLSLSLHINWGNYGFLGTRSRSFPSHMWSLRESWRRDLVKLGFVTACFQSFAL